MSYCSPSCRHQSKLYAEESSKEPFFAKQADTNKTGQNTFFQAHLTGNEPASIATKKLPGKESSVHLTSIKYKDNDRLQAAFDNSPLLKFGECNEAVRLLQEGMVADGFGMPVSTNEAGEMDGDFGSETFNTIQNFQSKHKLGRDGIVGRETLETLDDLANTDQLVPVDHSTAVKCHAKPSKEKPAPVEKGCNMHAEYANQRTINHCIPSSCGVALQFDIKKITKKGLSCPADFDGKILEEHVTVIESETTCPHQGKILTGSAKIEKDGRLNNATDTYGICFPKKITSDLMDFGIFHCNAAMRQELIIDGKVIEIRKINLRVDFDIDANGIICRGSGFVS